MINKETNDSPGLTQKTVSATKWSAGFSMVEQGFGTVITVILARLLVPEDFGLMAIVMVVIGIVRMFQDLGLGPALVQKKDLTKEHINSVFWAMLTFGLLLFLLFLASASLIARFYNEPRLTNLIIVVSLGFILGPLFIVHQRLLERKLDFKRLGIASIIVSVSTGLIAIYLAFIGWGVWSLVIYALLFYIFSPFIVWRFEGWRPQFKFQWEKCRELLNFGLSLSAGKVVGYLRLNIVFLIVGKVSGVYSAGIYKLSDRVVSRPLDNILALFQRALLASYSRVQDENSRLRRGYLMTTHYLGIVIFPAVLGIIVSAPEIVAVIFGEKWLRAIPIIQLLCTVGIINILINIGTSVCYAKSRPDINLKWNILALSVYVVAIILSAKQGITAVAASLALVSIPLFVVMQIYVNRLIELSWWEYIKNLLPSFLISLAMAVLVWGGRLWFFQLNFSQTRVLIAEIIVGVFSYSLLNLLFNREMVKRGWKMFINRYE